MLPRRNFSLLLPAFLCLAPLTSARLLAEEARAGATARYVVFEIDADGAVRPQMHRMVELSSAWRSLTPEEVASRLARPARDVEQVHVRMFADGGALAFEDVVAVPRWTRAELPVSADAPDAAIEGGLPLNGKRAFVVRVPLTRFFSRMVTIASSRSRSCFRTRSTSLRRAPVWAAKQMAG